MKTIANRYLEITQYASELFNNIVLTCCFFLVYKGILDFIFLKYVGGAYAYFGICISPVNIASGWLITIIMALVISEYYKGNTASSVMMVVFNMFYFIPMTTYCAYGGGSSSFLFWGIVYWALLSVLQLKLPVIAWGRSGQSEMSGTKVLLLSAIAGIPIVYVWVRYAKCRVLLRLGEIYQVRAEAAGYGLSTPLRYLLNMMPIVLALLIVLALSRRQYAALAILLALVFINFSIAGHKTVIFFPFILIGGYIFYRREMISIILPGGVFLELAAIAEQLFGKGLIINLLFRRMGFVLAQLSDFYYKFFTGSSIDLFRQGIIGKLGFDTIYSQSIANVIGNNFETQVVNCNNGIMADAWANLGLIGIFVMPVVLVYCMRFLDFASHNVDARLIIGMVVYYSFAFANSQWSIVLITHGFALMCIILMFFPREQSSKIR